MLSIVVVALVALSLTVGSALAAPPEKVTVCHNVGTDHQVELTVPANSAHPTKHVEEGKDSLGPCPAPYS